MREKTKTKFKFNSRDIQLSVMASFSLVFLLIFSYLPMMGIILAFKDGNKYLNIIMALGADWTLDNFKMLFTDSEFWQVFFNTLHINLLMLLINFPMPIIFALLINEVRNRFVRTTIQTVSNFPHFISWVVYGGIVLALTDANLGIVNPILEFLGLSTKENPIDLNLAQYFYPKLIIATIIKGVGWGSIVYVAAIAGIDQSLYEAAMIDGANRFQRAIHVTLPCIRSTILVFLLLNISRIMGNSFEQFYVFQTTANLSKTRVLATYMYTLGFTYRNYSTATALSLFEGIISLILLVSVNFVAKKTTGEGIY
ncbi:MAG: ABC transporter permease subunit [Candidatus Borkfalkiaceae bacterium]|nr:ABC transporter permease subunit [Clostridia bacterium]MDY6222566.1 ABC transporter permease subunit [Christensenellaceae bacterium]